MVFTKANITALSFNLFALAIMFEVIVGWSWIQHRYLIAFLALFLFRYTRVAISIYGNATYRPIPIPEKPMYYGSDVTVVIATANLMSDNLHNTMRSILVHPIKKFIIATAGPTAEEQKKSFQIHFKDDRLEFVHSEEISRRQQTALAMRKVETSLVVLQDDHSTWPASPSFLASILAPFEDSKTGAMTASMNARDHFYPISFAGFWNFLGMNYLTRAYEEMRGTFAVERAIFTLPGRFGVFRSRIYASREFLDEYLSEYVFFGRVGPLNADDDKFHTRWLMSHGWKIKLQAGPESTLITELGQWPKYNEQVLRWMRTTWRSNPRQLLNKSSWTRHPYTTYYLFLWFFRLSLFHEMGMFFCLRQAFKEAGRPEYFGLAASMLGFGILGLRLYRVLPQLQQQPMDIVYFPAYLLFVYWCTLVKTWALFTCWNASWEVIGAQDTSDETKQENEECMKTK